MKDLLFEFKMDTGITLTESEIETMGDEVFTCGFDEIIKIFPKYERFVNWLIENRVKK